MYQKFLNPYNFIPLPKKKAFAYADNAKKHTGVIEYQITTRSPLFIPNTSSEKAFANTVSEHGCYDFYSYNDLDEGKTYEKEYFEPVIPGSELRGMLRSVYETLTDSCMGVLNEDTYPVMRVSEMYSAGLLKRNSDKGYVLVDAEDCIYRKEDETKKGAYVKLYEVESTLEGSKVYFQKLDRGRKAKSLIKDITVKKDASHTEEGYLIKGMPDGSIGKKHNCHIFIPKKTTYDLTDQDIARLKAVLEAYKDEPNASDAYKEYSQQLEKFLHGNAHTKENEYFPVYYSRMEDKNKAYLYLAPACFSKEPSKHSLKELAGAFASCKRLEGSCPCCELFGMIGENNEQARASKIRFADARVVGNKALAEYYDEIVTLETLGSPRLNNVEFYLQQPKGADFWNYDYYTSQGKIILEKGILRGRKYYWHQKDKVLRKDVERTGLNKTVRPVRSGTAFRGRVFFEGISQKQLVQLLWILNGGNDTEQPDMGPIAYKLGMGKPLGLGSVELKVTKLSERIISMSDNSIDYVIKEEVPAIPVYEEAGFHPSVKEDFFTITSLDATKGKLVTYPIVDGQQDEAMTEGFKWFTENHIGYDYAKGREVRMPQKRVQMNRKYALPQIKDVQKLPIFGTKKKDTVLQQGGALHRGVVVTCKTTSRSMKNKYGEDYFVYVQYQQYKGMIFGVPEDIKKNDEVTCIVRNCGPDSFKGDYR